MALNFITFHEITRLSCSVPNPWTPVGFSSGAKTNKDKMKRYLTGNLKTFTKPDANAFSLVY